MNLSMLTLLPRLFATGQLLIRCFEDKKLDSDEVAKIIVEFRGLIATIPELKGFMAIFDVVIRVAAVVLPTFLGDKAKALELGLQYEQVEQAAAISQLFTQVLDDTIAEGDRAAAAISIDDTGDLL